MRRLFYYALLALPAFLMCLTGCTESSHTGVTTDIDSGAIPKAVNSIPANGETDSSGKSRISNPAKALSSINPADSGKDSGYCTDKCNSFNAADPVVSGDTSRGSVTTYGSTANPEFSEGGACNYGATRLNYYAAIHVNIKAGDLLGPWQEGRACGGCLSVKVKTENGWKHTFVRITDRCADQYCGVDLGGAPAADVMPSGPGRYEGEWTWQSCEGHPEVFDGPTAVWVKEGSNEFWSLIQVRNPISRVKGISYRKEGATVFTPLEWAGEAENFFTVPKEILQDDNNYVLRIEYGLSSSQKVVVKGSALAVAESIFEFGSTTGIKRHFPGILIY